MFNTLFEYSEKLPVPEYTRPTTNNEIILKDIVLASDDAYLVEMSSIDDFSNIEYTIASKTVDLTSLMLENGTTLFIRSKVTKGEKESGYSFLTKTYYEAPVVVSVVDPENGFYISKNSEITNITFTDSSKFSSHYTIELSKDIEFSNIFYESSITKPDTNFLINLDENFDIDDVIYYRIKTFNETAFSDWSDTRSFIISDD